MLIVHGRHYLLSARSSFDPRNLPTAFAGEDGFGQSSGFE